MAGTERALSDDDGPLTRFAADLRKLRQKAGLPPYRELGRRAHYSAAALSDAAGGRRLPSLAVTLAYVAACDGDTQAWEQRWHSVAAELSTGNAPEEPAAHDGEPAPYLGLAAFGTADAGRFFGRERLVDELGTRVAGHRFVVVVGASGSGKSSLLQAGLLHRVLAEGLPGTAGITPLVLTPGSHPLEECAARLAALTGATATSVHAALRDDPRALHRTALQILADRPAGAEVLVVVDQFEEVFTLCADAGERARFIEVLAAAARASNSRTRVVLGLRADFYAHCAHHPELLDALRDAQLLVGPMTTAELREAVTRPALDAGCRVENALVAELIGDAAGQPGVLPLVSHALLETWRRRRGTTLTLAGYHAAGGLDRSIARAAEAVYTGLSEGEREWARRLFVRLVALGEGTEDTRRRLDRAELDPAAPETTAVLERLAAARLVILDRHSVQLTHEALVRRWPRLQGWLTDDREGLRIHRQLTDAADAWQRLDRDPGAVYRGSRLDRADRWAAAGGRNALNARERDFLGASLAEQAREQAVARRRITRLRQFLAALTVLLVLTTGATAYAVRARQVSVGQRNLAITQKVLSQAAALRATNPALAMQLRLAAYRLAPVPEARASLLNMFTTPYAALLTGPSGAVQALAFSPDGRTLVAGDDDAVRLWDTADPNRPGRPALLTGLAGPFPSVAYSPDGRTVAAVGVDRAGLWDVTDPVRPRFRASIARPAGKIAFSPDGRTLAAGGGNAVRRWDLGDPDNPRELPPFPVGAGPVYDVAFGDGGRTLAAAVPAAGESLAGRHEVRLWNLARPGAPVTLAAEAGFVQVLAFTPDGRGLATGHGDDALTLWDVRDPARPVRLDRLTAATAAVNEAAFGPDGHTLATAGADREIQLWDVTDLRHARAVATLQGATAPVTTLAFRPDGRTLAAANSDGIVRLESVAEYTFPARAGGGVEVVDFSADGGTLVSGHADGTVGVAAAADPYRPVLFPAGPSGLPIVAVALAPDGRTLASTDATGAVVLWDLRGRRIAVVAPRPRSLVPVTPALAFAPDGRTLAASGRDNSVRLWDVADPRRPRALAGIDGLSAAVNSVAFSPDGRLLATAGDGTGSGLWDLADLRRPRRLSVLTGPAPGPVLAVAFGAGGRTLALANPDRTVGLWDVADPARPRAVTILSAASRVYSVAFSPDGRRLAAGTIHGTTSVWDVTDPGRPPVELTSSGPVHSVAFGPDNHVLATAGVDWRGVNGSLRLWEMDPERVAVRVCGLARPAITRTEWRQFFPGLAYRPPCP
ncbi:hypothetical protein [Pseudosporangium ferrugineum]|uniref:WD40 repeat protein n=1 Tax=Pseudosporangium ferrugineum TaxID=439699 RepID=A0A2T0SDA5_9ACTN|nr:hypothetical protein [Pseudosporangium ferrugineum]PRY31405.1 WD40 repeat protein [Pseudosporangium ferrugineum]